MNRERKNVRDKARQIFELATRPAGAVSPAKKQKQRSTLDKHAELLTRASEDFKAIMTGTPLPWHQSKEEEKARKDSLAYFRRQREQEQDGADGEAVGSPKNNENWVTFHTSRLAIERARVESYGLRLNDDGDVVTQDGTLFTGVAAQMPEPDPEPENVEPHAEQEEIALPRDDEIDAAQQGWADDVVGPGDEHPFPEGIADDFSAAFFNEMEPQAAFQPQEHANFRYEDAPNFSPGGQPEINQEYPLPPELGHREYAESIPAGQQMIQEPFLEAENQLYPPFFFSPVQPQQAPIAQPSLPLDDGHQLAMANGVNPLLVHSQPLQVNDVPEEAHLDMAPPMQSVDLQSQSVGGNNYAHAAHPFRFPTVPAFSPANVQYQSMTVNNFPQGFQPPQDQMFARPQQVFSQTFQPPQDQMFIDPQLAVSQDLPGPMHQGVIPTGLRTSHNPPLPSMSGLGGYAANFGNC